VAFNPFYPAPSVRGTGRDQDRELIQHSRLPLSALSDGQFIEQRLSFFQIKSVEPLGEPTVHRREKFASLLLLALIAPEPRHAHCGAQLE
jgi:hypothetical protein